MARGDGIPVLQKAIRVMAALAEGRCEPTPLGLSRALKIAPATAYRIVSTFAGAGWITAADDRRLAVGVGVLPVLRAIQDVDLVGPAVRAALTELAAGTGLASKVSIRDGDEAVTLLRVNAPGPMALAIQPGARFHLTLGSGGTVLLSVLDDGQIQRIIDAAPGTCWRHQSPPDVWKRIRQFRRDGVAEDLGHYRPDVLGLSAGLCDAAGRPVAALTVTGLRHGQTPAQVHRWQSMLVAAAAKLGTFDLTENLRHEDHRHQGANRRHSTQRAASPQHRRSSRVLPENRA